MYIAIEFWSGFSPQVRGYSAQPVHPRACGEHYVHVFVPVNFLGSSPRMRGTSICIGSAIGKLRFIPAHAGNMLLFCVQQRPFPVHPRACGEHGADLGDVHLRHGSSPRMRGTSKQLPALQAVDRFIPAHAGNIRSILTIPRSAPVHPRACGEHLAIHRQKTFVIGSSPRMRGT